MSHRRSAEHSRNTFNARLRERRREIEAAILNRIQSDGAPTEAPDPSYAEGLRDAVPAALAYCLASIEHGDDHAPSLPAALLSQARVAARNGIGLDIVLRRYFVGYTLLGDFMLDEVQAMAIYKATNLKRSLRNLAVGFERLLVAVSEEYGREAAVRPVSGEELRARRVERLLAGELIDTNELDYDLEGYHLGMIAPMRNAAEVMSEIAASFDRRLFLVPRTEGTVWAWLGGRSPLATLELQSRFSTALSNKVTLAVGEPAQGLSGWRLSHRQARAALPIAMRGPKGLVRYADVALVSSILQDDLLNTSLRQSYLVPLRLERDGGQIARETLRAYFDADRNVSSAAATLGVRRHTVAGRLRRIEELIGQPLSRCASEMDAALRLQELKTKPQS